MLTLPLFLSVVVFSGHLIVAEPGASQAQPGVVLAPSDHRPTLLIEAESLSSFVPEKGTGLMLRSMTAPSGAMAYALSTPITTSSGTVVYTPTLFGCEVAFKGAAGSATVIKTGTPKLSPSAGDWDYLNYLPDLASVFGRRALKAQYLTDFGKMSDWSEIGARFWLVGATELGGRAPDASFLTSHWACEPGTKDSCSFTGAYKVQGLADTLEARFPKNNTLLVSDAKGNLLATIVLANVGRVWLLGAAEFDSLSDPDGALAHFKHYEHFLKGSPTGNTIRRNGHEAGPVFCPPSLGSY
jgi:hypothetical protein